MVLFTDGSCEPTDKNDLGLEAGYGAVLVNPSDRTGQAFGAVCGLEMMSRLTYWGTKRQVVGQTELLPVLASLNLWKREVAQKAITVYIDNEAARYGLIKGSSATRDSAWLINEIWTTAADLEVDLWIERVPSASNCADGPSRGKMKSLTNSGIKIKTRKLNRSFERGLLEQWTRCDGVDQPMP